MSPSLLTIEGFRNRRRRVRQGLPEGCETVVVADPASVAYLTGFSSSPLVFQGSACQAVAVMSGDKVVLIADNQAIKAFGDGVVADDVVTPVFYEGKRSAPLRPSVLINPTIEVIKSLGARKLAVEWHAVPVGILEGWREGSPQADSSNLIDVGPALRAARKLKEEDEVAVLKRSMDAIAAGFAEARRELKPGMTEQDACQLIVGASERFLGERALVYGDFASNPSGRSIRRGGPPTDRVLQAGDWFILDFSVIVQGYRGDYANTFIIDGRPTERQAALYQACLDALAVGESRIRPGVAAREVDRAMRAVFEERGLGENFTSHNGHGVGLAHLEPPFVVPESEDVFEVGDVFTLEPGQYLDGVAAMRVERNYRLGTSGLEVLSSHELTLV
ncbi:peptidase M24 [Isosphaera pallida ATCC 43644]|uniref:Peptidase M24 n=1 Tax=Isosphaera pallida (strain ATCC 43644 / DSM 9630 / IS1B) TaxID=575540 RepID=E8R419_ISOPI|nr:Xaa-Pro peptidase family protein [Isosphaera pallida]ADV61606.1 peptidase M24 [Isosphaera pallida ATCC 43644]